MSDLVQRLRAQGKDAFAKHYSLGMFKLCDEAADCIEALEMALRVSHQNCLALWEALEGGASPRCRDCADFDGRCQGNGPACDPQERALERIKALRRRVLAPEPSK